MGQNTSVFPNLYNNYTPLAQAKSLVKEWGKVCVTNGYFTYDKEEDQLKEQSVYQQKKSNEFIYNIVQSSTETRICFFNLLQKKFSETFENEFNRPPYNSVENAIMLKTCIMNLKYNSAEEIAFLRMLKEIITKNISVCIHPFLLLPANRYLDNIGQERRNRINNINYTNKDEKGGIKNNAPKFSLEETLKNNKSPAIPLQSLQNINNITERIIIIIMFEWNEHHNSKLKKDHLLTLINTTCEILEWADTMNENREREEREEEEGKEEEGGGEGGRGMRGEGEGGEGGEEEGKEEGEENNKRKEKEIEKEIQKEKKKGENFWRRESIFRDLINSIEFFFRNRNDNGGDDIIKDNRVPSLINNILLNHINKLNSFIINKDITPLSSYLDSFFRPVNELNTSHYHYSCLSGIPLFSFRTMSEILDCLISINYYERNDDDDDDDDEREEEEEEEEEGREERRERGKKEKEKEKNKRNELDDICTNISELWMNTIERVCMEGLYGMNGNIKDREGKKGRKRKEKKKKKEKINNYSSISLSKKRNLIKIAFDEKPRCISSARETVRKYPISKWSDSITNFFLHFNFFIFTPSLSLLSPSSFFFFLRPIHSNPDYSSLLRKFRAEEPNFPFLNSISERSDSLDSLKRIFQMGRDEDTHKIWFISRGKRRGGCGCIEMLCKIICSEGWRLGEGGGGRGVEKGKKKRERKKEKDGEEEKKEEKEMEKEEEEKEEKGIEKEEEGESESEEEEEEKEKEKEEKEIKSRYPENKERLQRHKNIGRAFEIFNDVIYSSFDSLYCLLDTLFGSFRVNETLYRESNISYFLKRGEEGKKDWDEICDELEEEDIKECCILYLVQMKDNNNNNKNKNKKINVLFEYERTEQSRIGLNCLNLLRCPLDYFSPLNKDFYY